MHIFDHNFRFQVDFVIVFRTAAVFFLLAVLAHHDQRRLDCRHTGKHKVEQDKGVRVKRIGSHNNIDSHPEQQHADEGKNERPAPRKPRDFIGGTLTERITFLRFFDCIYRNAAARKQGKHFFVRHIAANVFYDFADKFFILFHTSTV